MHFGIGTTDSHLFLLPIRETIPLVKGSQLPKFLRNAGFCQLLEFGEIVSFGLDKWNTTSRNMDLSWQANHRPNFLTLRTKLYNDLQIAWIKSI